MLQSLDRLKGDGAGLLSSPPSPRAITRFLGELALMLRSGLPLDEALALSAEGQPARLGRIVLAVRREVLGGASFVQALEHHPEVFTKDVVAMARIADATGDLAGVFAAVASQRERNHRLAEKVTGSLRYPAFLIVSALGVLVFFLVNVIPNFSGLFADSGTDPGALVRFVLAASDWLVANETNLESRARRPAARRLPGLAHRRGARRALRRLPARARHRRRSGACGGRRGSCRTCRCCSARACR